MRRETSNVVFIFVSVSLLVWIRSVNKESKVQIFPAIVMEQRPLIFSMKFVDHQKMIGKRNGELYNFTLYKSIPHKSLAKSYHAKRDSIIIKTASVKGICFGK